MNLEQIIENNRITQNPVLDLRGSHSRHDLVDISLLANLTHLEKLYIVYLKIEDLSPLQNLHQLKEIWLQNNKITDISPLFKLTNIESLDLDSNEISDTSAFEIENSSLTTLWLCNNIGIRDFSFLHYLPNTLVNLQLGGNFVNDFSFLRKIAKTIIKLKISQTHIKDFSFIQDFPVFEKLTHLDLSRNSLENTDFVAFLPVLEDLCIAYNNINIIKIKNAHNIKQVSLAENPLTKIIIENSNAFSVYGTGYDYESFPLEDLKDIEMEYDGIYTQRLFENARETASFTVKSQSKIKHTDLPNVTELTFVGDRNDTFSSDGFVTNEDCFTVDIAELVVFNPKIETLVLEHVATRNIEALENLLYLTSLTISYPKVRIESLPKIEKLKFIDVSGRFDILEFAGDNFPSLTNIHVYYGEVKTLILKDLPKFTRFDVFEGIENLSIVNCPLLKEINLANGTNITSKNLPALENVKISQGNIASLLFVKDITHIKNLDLSECGNMTHFEVIKELKNLISFSCGEPYHQTSTQKINQKTLDLSLFENLTNLEYLYLNSQDITNISPLKNLKNLKTLNLAHNKITDISVVKHLPNLTYLNLNDNQIEDISSILTLDKLENLALDNNQIQDFSAIKFLKSLKYIDIRENPFPLPPQRWLVHFMHDRSTHSLPELPFINEIWQLIASESDFEELAKQLARGQNWSEEDITAYFAFRRSFFTEDDLPF